MTEEGGPTEGGGPTEQELLEQLKQLKVDDLLLQTVVALINLTGHKLEAGDPDEAKKGIDAARAILPLCPADQQEPIKQVLSQLQMAYVQATKKQEPPEPPKPDIWTPGGNS